MIKMNLLKIALLALFGVSAFVNIFNCGKYAYGGREVKEGIDAVVTSFIASLIDIVFLYWVFTEM
jgi:hypothetical protein